MAPAAGQRRLRRARGCSARPDGIGRRVPWLWAVAVAVPRSAVAASSKEMARSGSGELQHEGPPLPPRHPKVPAADTSELPARCVDSSLTNCTNLDSPNIFSSFCPSGKSEQMMEYIEKLHRHNTLRKFLFSPFGNKMPPLQAVSLFLYIVVSYNLYPSSVSLPAERCEDVVCQAAQVSSY
ncbi:hypothetical protein EJB05_14121, partial [Eragrostis curvula]